MGPSDLQALDALLSSAVAVLPMRDIHDGVTHPDVIGLRHDVDDNPFSLETAVKMAHWEQEHGYASTYFLLHTASYWDSPEFVPAVDEIASCGHEIGIHTNAITAALTGGGDPELILHIALDRLRAIGHKVTGVAPHGDRLCYTASFINDEIFRECPRPDMGEPDRILSNGSMAFKLCPKPLGNWGLEYETYRLPRGRYLSDSGGRWHVPIDAIGDLPGQLHILQHPDWWADAFPRGT